MIELEGLLFDKMIEIRCENEHTCVFCRRRIPEFKVTHKQGCPEKCEYRIKGECEIKNIGA